MNLPEEMIAYYEQGREHSRLTSGSGQLEFNRTLSIILRSAPDAPARVLDVGGGAGIYAFELAALGYSVELIDAIPLHIQQAKSNPAARNLMSIAVGDARCLTQEEDAFDVVLLLGPLYHLIDRVDRVTALREATRVLKPGGVLICSAISKFASLLDGYFSGFIQDPEFAKIVDRDLTDGQHRNPTDNPAYFTTTKFHSAHELEQEMSQAGLQHVQLKAVEGFGWILPANGQEQSCPDARLLAHLQQIEDDRDVIGVSAHIVGVGIKPQHRPV